MNTIRRVRREWENENERRLELLSSELSRWTVNVGARLSLALSFGIYLLWRSASWTLKIIGLSLSIILMDSRLVIKQGPEARSQDLNEVLRSGYNKW